MRIISYIIFIAIIFQDINAQENFYTAFWNVENLFDTTDTTGKDDSEFLPSGEKKWDQDKFHKKIINLSTVIMSMNRGKGPDILGLCEVENKAVVESLVVYLNPEYGIIHDESPDARGIDNALIYRKNLFNPASVKSHPVDLGRGKTRSILNAELKGNFPGVLNLFINHWPSRAGGEESEGKRFLAAATLKKQLTILDNKNFIIIMGDFNDEPENKSLDSILEAGSRKGSKGLWNLAYEKSLAGEGSYKYRDTWNMLDQIIISDNAQANNITYIDGSFEVYKPDFMITTSGKFAGTPRPAYGGNRYLGGYSDHFPVIALFRNNRQ